MRWATYALISSNAASSLFVMQAWLHTFLDTSTASLLWNFNIARAPRSDDISDEFGIGLVRHQVIGLAQRKKALGVCRGLEQRRGMLNGHSAVTRSMHDEQGLVQIAHLRQHALLGGIVQK